VSSPPERRWLWSALALGVCVALGSSRELAPVRVALAAAGAAGAAERTQGALGTAGPAGTGALVRGACPPGTAADDGVCVHLGAPMEDGPLAPAVANVHHEKSGRIASYEHIPRLPERPSDYDAYRYPVPPGIAGGHYVVSGYDLDRPDEKQRRGRTLKHVGHGGVDLPQAKGTKVLLVALEHQEGDAEVLYAGPLFGTTVVTRHTLREGGRLRDYIVLFGHLDAISPGLAPGAAVRDGDAVGAVGDTGSPELVHLHLEVRRVREGVDVAKVPAGAPLLSESVSTVCDPRNVFPLAR
jgi:hypothetical protein